MVTPSRVRMNKLRHKHGMIAKNRKEELEQEKFREGLKEEVSEKQHKERLQKLKEMGLLK